MDEVIEFLNRLDLSEYSSNFENEGWDRLEDLEHMTDEDLHQVIKKKGHVRRLKTAIKQRSARTERTRGFNSARSPPSVPDVKGKLAQ